MTTNGTGTGGNAGAPGPPVGHVFVIFGTVHAVSPDGSERLLSPNSLIYEGDRIVTEGDGRVSINFNGPGNPHMELGRNSDVVIDEDVFEHGIPPNIQEIVAEQADLEQLFEDGIKRVRVKLNSYTSS